MSGILIVDRAQVDCDILKALLRLVGYEAMTISSIWAAIDYLDLAAKSLTVALVEDRLLLRTTLREHLPAPAECPIVALSRVCTAAERDRLRQLGVVEILAKPYERETLQALVRRLG